MGKIFNTSTWRAPLQLIDCWLPLPSERRTHTGLLKTPGNVVQRFARAGWLQREAANGPSDKAGQDQVSLAGASPGCRVRLLRQSDHPRSAPRDTRLFISGSMTDVCAELDRLAALEKTSAARAA